MSGMWVRGRAADRFDAAIADVSGRGAPASPAPAELVDLVAALRAVPDVAPRPEHAVALRERLMVEADRLAGLRADDAPVAAAATAAEDRLRLRGSRRHPRRFAVLAGTVAALGASTSVAVAAQSALPGESLYPIKRALEDAQAGVTRDPADQGELLLVNAADRLGEASALLASDDPSASDEIGPTLDSFTDQATDGAERLLAEYERTGDRELVRDLRDFATVSGGELDDMAVDLPASARDAWSRAVRAVEDVEADTVAACPLCIADPTGFESGDERLTAGDELPGSDTSATPGPDRGTAGGSDGDRRGAGDRDGRGRRGGLLPGGPGDGDGDGRGRGDGRGDGGSDRDTPTTPELPDSGDGLGDGLGDALGGGVASGLGDGLRDGLGGLREGLGLGGSRDGRSGDGKGRRGGDRDRGGSGRSGGGSGGLGDGLDDLLP